MRIQSIIAVCALGLLACSPSLAQDVSVDAAFEREEPASALMTLSRDGEAWRVGFRAGGLPNGAATAADCELQAVGPQDGEDVITARIVPFEGDINTILATDIGADASVITVRVGPEGAFVSDDGAAARFCGLGSDIEGFYRRTGDQE